jgi:glycosyltransferase involved in cell wall biosynthesis
LNKQPDIVIPFGLAYLESSISAAQGINCRIVYAEKNAPEVEFPKKGSDEFNYYIRLLKKIHGVVVQTDKEKQYFEGVLTNIHVINNPVKQGLPLPYTGRRKKIIVNFCRMSAQKNLELLIDAFARIVVEYIDFKLIIYGNTVEESEIQYKESVIKKISELRIEDSVFVFPPTADVHKRVLDSAMFVSSSDYEGLSNSMIEAMAIGLPCICTDCLGGGTREVMVDGENGLIVPVNDADEMYRAMKRFVENPEFAEKCGRNAAKIRENLSVEKIAQQWIEVFQR